MLRRDVLRAGAVAGAVAVGGCQRGYRKAAFREGFEDGSEDWTAGAAIGPEVHIEDFEWEVGVSDEQAAAGDRSLRVWNEGDYDDGVTWALHPVAIEPGRYRIFVTAQFWSESESFNTIRDAVIRLGPEPPEAEADFPHPGVNTTEIGETAYGGLREPLWLADGWREYGFEWTTPRLDAERLYLAVGTSVIWEADATHYVDEISVEIASR
jgi:hypothetical protein